MTEEELKALNKDMKKKQRIATEWASKIHDLVEDRLMTGYDELPELASQTVAACQEWAEAKAKLEAVEAAAQ